MKTSKILLSVSVASFIYFCYLIFISYYPDRAYVNLKVLGVFIELLTIPLFLAVLFCFVFSIVKLIQKSDTKVFLAVFLINLVTLSAIVIRTIADLNG